MWQKAYDCHIGVTKFQKCNGISQECWNSVEWFHESVKSYASVW